jgi:hypothetical protein
MKGERKPLLDDLARTEAELTESEAEQGRGGALPRLDLKVEPVDAFGGPVPFIRGEGNSQPQRD